MDPQENNNFFDHLSSSSLDPYTFTNPQPDGFLPDFSSSENYASTDPPQTTSTAGMTTNTLGEATDSNNPTEPDGDDASAPTPQEKWKKTAKELTILMASFENYGPWKAPDEEIARLSTLLQHSKKQIVHWWHGEQKKRREALKTGRVSVQLSDQVKSTIDAAIRKLQEFSDWNLRKVADQINVDWKVLHAYVLNTYDIITMESGFQIVANVCFAETLKVLGSGITAAALEPAFRSIMARSRADSRAVLPTFPLYSVHPSLSSPLAGLWKNLLAELTPRRVLTLSHFASPWGDADSALLIIPDSAPTNNETKSVYNLQDENTALLLKKLGLDGLEGEKPAQHQSVLISCLVPDQMSATHGILDEYMAFTKSILCISTARVCITLGKAANDAVHELLGDDITALAELNTGTIHQVFVRVSLQYLTKQDKLLKRVHRVIFGFPRLTDLTPKSVAGGSAEMIDRLRKIECVLNTAILLAFGDVARPSYLMEQS